ncbi:MAG: hypothetical protein R3F62_23455 [Planctomycetota bacterium]
MSGLLGLFLCGAVCAQEPIFAGRYALEGTADDGRDGIEVTLEVEREADGLRLTRTEKRPGPDPRWTATGRVEAQEDGTWSVEVLYRVEREAGGIAGGLAPAPGPMPPNRLSAVYVFTEDSSVRERVTNLTRLDPEASWGSALGNGRRDLDGRTYGEIAEALIVPAYDRLNTNLAGFDENTLPHEAKDLRKELGRLRDFLDIFAYAFPHVGGFDPWEDLRRSLDRGYERMGAFKDLYDAQGLEDPALATYVPQEVAELRREVLEWLADYRDPARNTFFRVYLQSASRTRIHKRSKDDLSDIYWGGTTIHPHRDDRGLETLARLEHALLDRAREDLDGFEHLKDLTKGSQEEVFHSFRKALRGTLNVAGYVPHILEGGGRTRELVALLEEAVDRMGDLNDTLVAYHLAEARDDEERVEELEEQIEDAWDDLVDWVEDEDLDDALEDFARRVDD